VYLGLAIVRINVGGKTQTGNLTGLNYLISEGHRVTKWGLGGWKKEVGVGVVAAPL
jgi:hypothetical protein